MQLSQLYICHQIITRLIVIPLLTQVSQQYIQSYTIMQHSAVSQQLVQLQSSQQVYVCSRKKIEFDGLSQNVASAPRAHRDAFTYICPVHTCLYRNQNIFRKQYSYLFNRRVYQLSMQGDIFEKKRGWILMGFLITPLHKNSQNDVKLLKY